MTVSAGSVPGGPGRRFFAFQVDQFIIVSLWLLLAGWIGAIYLSLSRWPGDLRSLAALGGLLAALGVVLHAVYWVVFVGSCGQTPGKMLLGLEVVGRAGEEVGYGRALCRWVGMGFAALPFGLGFVGVMVTRERRGLHDWLAGTRVVRLGPPVTAPEEAAGARSEPARSIFSVRYG